MVRKESKNQGMDSWRYGISIRLGMKSWKSEGRCLSVKGFVGLGSLYHYMGIGSKEKRKVRKGTVGHRQTLISLS